MASVMGSEDNRRCHRVAAERGQRLHDAVGAQSHEGEGGEVG
jgi:hypothetical protein